MLASMQMDSHLQRGWGVLSQQVVVCWEWGKRALLSHGSGQSSVLYPGLTLQG